MVLSINLPRSVIKLSLVSILSPLAHVKYLNCCRMNKTSVLAFLFFFIYATEAVDEKFKQDLFNLYKNIAIETRDIKGTPVYAENVTYYLFTKKNPTEYTKIDPENPTAITGKDATYIFIIHGWTGNREAEWYEQLKDAFLSRSNQNQVIQVDWRGPANELYAISSINTRDVGKIVGKFVVNLHKKKGIPLKNFHIVGHSLGGQVAGFIAKTVYNETSQRLPRITALDPAGPLFSVRPEEERLNKNDADNVVVIHTDGGKLGYQDPVGTLDFFPNGGSDQPGCTKIDLLDVTSVADPIWCDHARSWAFYIEAVLNPDKFVAEKCTVKTKLLVLEDKQCDENDTVNMGDLKTTKTGNYYLETNSEKPYGKKTKGFDITKLIPKI